MIAISHLVADQLIDQGVPAARIRVVLNGIGSVSKALSDPVGMDMLIVKLQDCNKHVAHGLRAFALFLSRRPRTGSEN